MARRKGVGLYAMASIVAPFAALIRNIVIARLLGPELFGLAVTLIVTAQFFDTVLDAGSDKFIVQNRDGTEGSVIATAHAAMLVRGTISAAMMLAAAWPLAHFYRQPALTLPLALLALVPLVTGMWNLDVRRLQKEGDFSAEGKQILVAEIGSLCVAIISAMVLRNYYAALWSLVARSAIAALMSHMVAKRPYRVAVDSEIARRLWRFGWPLVLNGGLVFLGGQGDRVMIAHFLGPIDLGLYSTALLLIFYPTAIIQRVLSGLHYPLLAIRRGEPAYAKAESLLVGHFLLTGAVSAVGFTIITPILLPIVYGHAYAMPALTIGLIGLLQIIRMIRVVPATIAFAHGLTGNVLAGNILRLVSFPLAAWMIARHEGLIGLILGFLVGEAIALIGTQILLTRKLGESTLRAWAMAPSLLATGVSCLAVAHNASTGFTMSSAVFTLGSMLCLILVLAAHGGVRFAIIDSMARVRNLRFSAFGRSA